MAPQPTIQEFLEAVLETDEVYFQPGRNVTMEYPACVYSVDGLATDWADNLAYHQNVEYEVVYITRKVDDDAWRKLGRLPKSTLNRADVIDNLYHYYFTLYF